MTLSTKLPSAFQKTKYVSTYCSSLKYVYVGIKYVLVLYYYTERFIAQFHIRQEVQT